MDREDFLSKWTKIGAEHLVAKEISLENFVIGPASRDFLFITGIPSEFQDLNFDYLKAPLETVNEKWSLNDPYFNRYLAIGFNGAGDPIAINLDNQELIYLNHDNNFEEVFINSDLERFALSVVCLSTFCDHLRKLNADSVFTTEFSDDELEHVIMDLKLIDSKIFEIADSHWRLTVDYIKWERDERKELSN